MVNSRGGRPNILLLVLDTLRADAVEPYGASPGSSPALADLGRRGTAVPGVRATASWTLPSHISMFTGRLSRGLGLGQAPGNTAQSAGPVVRAQQDHLLAEVLRRAGYATGGVTTNMWVSSWAGFDTGFDRFVELQTARQQQLGGDFRQRLKWDWEGMLGRADDGAAEAEKVITRWVKEPPSRPFFWFVNLVECHSPYLPPKPYDGTSAAGRLRAADEANRYLSFAAILRICVGAQRISERALERMRHLYAASLRYVDEWIARVLDSLDRAGILEETLVIVCSDHGENFGEHGLIGHTLSVDDRLLRVPFIVAGPGREHFDGMLSLAELPWRIAAAAGVERHPWPVGLEAGLPVAQWDPLAPASHPRVAKVVEEWGLDAEAVDRLTRRLTASVSGHFKLVCGDDDNDEELFDLQADPLELAPLREGSAIAARAGERLAALRAAIRHPAVKATAEAVRAVPSEASEDEVAELERSMRVMGYM